MTTVPHSPASSSGTLAAAPPRSSVTGWRWFPSCSLMNGLLVGGWAPAIPVFKDNHALAESQLGLMILLIGIGSFITMPITGGIIARRGSTSILKIPATYFHRPTPPCFSAPLVGVRGCEAI